MCACSVVGDLMKSANFRSQASADLQMYLKRSNASKTMVRPFTMQADLISPERCTANAACQGIRVCRGEGKYSYG